MADSGAAGGGGGGWNIRSHQQVNELALSWKASALPAPVHLEKCYSLNLTLYLRVRGYRLGSPTTPMGQRRVVLLVMVVEEDQSFLGDQTLSLSGFEQL